MRRVLAQASWIAASLALLAWGASSTSAAGSDVEGRGFGAQLPQGFRPAGSSDEGAGSQRTFRRRVESGDLRLTFSSCDKSDPAFAALEMQLGASELEQGEAPASEVRVSGAQKAHQTVVRGTEGSERTLMARADRIIVTVTLAAPAEADAEAAEAWNGILASLRIADSSGGVINVLLIILGALALLSVGLRLAHGGARRAHAPPTADGFEMALAQVPPVEAYQPSPMPSQTSAVPRGTGAGFSRPDDGLAVFVAGAKNKGGADLSLKLPDVPRRAPAAPPSPPRVPNLRPPTPAIRV